MKSDEGGCLEGWKAVKRHEGGSGVGETWRMKKREKRKQRREEEPSGMHELVNRQKDQTTRNSPK
jgi:hypothetical protein